MGKPNQITVTVGMEERSLIKKIASRWGRTEGDVVADGWRRSIKDQLADCETADKFEFARADIKKTDPNEIFERIKSGQDVTDEELSEASHDTGIKLEILEDYRNCHKKDGKTHVPA